MSQADNEKYEMKCRELTTLSERIINFKRWGFRQSVVIATRFPPTIIYDSEFCRVRIYWEGWDAYTGDTIQIGYGRLHAPSDGSIMTVNGETYFCWHGIDEVLNFLDGLSPQEAVDLMGLYGY